MTASAQFFADDKPARFILLGSNVVSIIFCQVVLKFGVDPVGVFPIEAVLQMFFLPDAVLSCCLCESEVNDFVVPV